MKRCATLLFVLLLSRVGFSAVLSYNDVQLCINAYNHLWWTFESAKSEFRGDPDAQAGVFTAEFPSILDPNFHFEVLSLPLPPDFTSTIDLIIDGIPNLVQTAAYGINNFGELHVATPFSVKETDSSIIHNTKVYSLTTRDIDYVRDPAEEGGCTVYTSQKDVVCTVSNHSLLNDRRAILNSIVDNVIMAYTIAAPQCQLWSTPPVTDYIN